MAGFSRTCFIACQVASIGLGYDTSLTHGRTGMYSKYYAVNNNNSNKYYSGGYSYMKTSMYSYTLELGKRWDHRTSKWIWCVNTNVGSRKSYCVESNWPALKYWRASSGVCREVVIHGAHAGKDFKTNIIRMNCGSRIKAIVRDPNVKVSISTMYNDRSLLIDVCKKCWCPKSSDFTNGQKMKSVGATLCTCADVGRRYTQKKKVEDGCYVVVNHCVHNSNVWGDGTGTYRIVYCWVKRGAAQEVRYTKPSNLESIKGVVARDNSALKFFLALWSGDMMRLKCLRIPVIQAGTRFGERFEDLVYCINGSRNFEQVQHFKALPKLQELCVQFSNEMQRDSWLQTFEL